MADAADSRTEFKSYVCRPYQDFHLIINLEVWFPRIPEMTILPFELPLICRR